MRELLAFGAVGILATAVHYTIALVAIELFAVGELLANFIAYCCAVGVSFFGHSSVTFRASMTRDRLFKFVLVSVSALGFSQVILYTLTTLAWFDHRVNLLFVVGFVPCYSYLLNKFWVYRVRSMEVN